MIDKAAGGLQNTIPAAICRSLTLKWLASHYSPSKMLASKHTSIYWSPSNIDVIVNDRGERPLADWP
jgi:hypothetical protein